MTIALIVAMTKNRLIGRANQLPWNLPDDLAHFRTLTHHKPIIMGRNTFESIGRPLPQRDNIVISRTQPPQPGIVIYPTLSEALAAYHDTPEVMVIGGRALFAEALPLADTLYFTHIDATLEGDVYFPEWNTSQWQVVSEEWHEKDTHHAYRFGFFTYRRKK